MPRPKSMLIALFVLTAFTLCAACTEKSECSRVSQDLRKFNGPPISFNYSSDMELKKIAYKLSNGCILQTAPPTGLAQFSAWALPDPDTNPVKALDSKVKSILKNKHVNTRRLSIDIKEVERTIHGKQLSGKELHIYQEQASPKIKIENDTIYLIFAYQKDSQLILLTFITTPKDRALAECYFKIITDSIQ